MQLSRNVSLDCLIGRFSFFYMRMAHHQATTFVLYHTHATERCGQPVLQAGDDLAV